MSMKPIRFRITLLDCVGEEMDNLEMLARRKFRELSAAELTLLRSVQNGAAAFRIPEIRATSNMTNIPVKMRRKRLNGAHESRGRYFKARTGEMNSPIYIRPQLNRFPNINLK